MGVSTFFSNGFKLTFHTKDGDEEANVDEKTLKSLENKVKKALESDYEYIESSWNFDYDADEGASVSLSEEEVGTSVFNIVPHLFVIIKVAFSMNLKLVGGYTIFTDDFAGGVITVTSHGKNGDDVIVKVVRTITPTEDVNTPTKMTTASLKKFLARQWKDLEEFVTNVDKSEVTLVPAGSAKAGGKAGAKERKKKDPNAPKRPQTAYFLWLNDNRAALKKANPDAKVTDIAKLAGQKWKEVPAKTKKKYEDLNAKDKTRYETEMAEYKEKQ